jgi:cell division protein FtsB
MPRRVTKKRPSLLAPAGDFIKRLSDDSPRLRRRLLLVGFWSVALFFGYSLASGDYGVPHITKLELESRGLQDANRRLLVQLLDATRERNMLRSDSAYIEFIARTQFHMARANETIFRYRTR